MLLVVVVVLAVPRLRQKLDRLLGPSGQSGVPRDSMGKIARSGDGAWDPHPDSDVVRVMIPWADRTFHEADLYTNSWGFREKEIETPKPEGLLRIVFLGDSFTFGMFCASNERAGVHLTRYLKERAGEGAPDVEVLHIGIPSWGLLNQAIYMRRALSVFDPDLVFMHTCTNDLDDTAGVRGFGLLGNFDHTHPNRGESMVVYRYGLLFLDPESPVNYMLTALEHEGKKRYRETRDAVAELRDACVRRGAKFQIVSNWGGLSALLIEQWQDEFQLDDYTVISHEFSHNERYRVTPTNGHWNPEGMRMIGKLLYGAILERDLLPDYPVGDWPEARELFDEMWNSFEGADPNRVRMGLARHQRIDHSLSTSGDWAEEGTHVLSGLKQDGHAGPHTMISLLGREHTRLRFKGRALGRDELQGMTIQIRLHGTELHSFSPEPDDEFDLTVALPEEFHADLQLMTFELIADDYGYMGPHLRNCVSYHLELLELLE